MVSGFDNEIDLAGSKRLEGMKVYNIKPQKIVSSPQKVTVWSCWLRVLPKELDEKILVSYILLRSVTSSLDSYIEG